MKTLRPSLPTLGQSTSAGGWKPDSERGSRHQRGYGYAWEKLRAEVLDRDNGLCQPCFKLNPQRITMATQVDHKTPKSRGGTDELTNLQAICEACHLAKTALESTDRGGACR